MRHAEIVIGANFGDEGKGLITDYYASQYDDCVVVRHNGGAQAGHTVVTPEGQRHAFSHFSSGSFLNAPTFLSRYFLVNPILFFKELEKLQLIGIKPKVFVDRTALLTTPYDMLINQLVEKSRGTDRHGSCGVGINETVQRCLSEQWRTTVADISRPDWLRDRLDRIRRVYLPNRINELIGKSQDEILILNDNLLDNFMADCIRFASEVEIVRGSWLRDSRSQLIFEGAQGLLLDEDHKWFPHVTRSKTGSVNALRLATEAEVDSIRITYVTRSYVTRHGDGPLPHALSVPVYRDIVDATNVLNEYQGRLRFAHLDLNILRGSILDDLKWSGGNLNAHRVAVTCLDQIPSDSSWGAWFVANGELQMALVEQLVTAVADFTETNELLTSYGPTRNDVGVKLLRSVAA